MNIKNHKMDNRGLTLVELLVAIVISTIVIGAIWQFMLVSTRSYQSQKTITELQQEVQQTMNHAENLIIDANRSVVYYLESSQAASDFDAPADKATKTLEVYSSDKVGKLIWTKATKQVVYEETVVNNGVLDPDTTESAVLAEGVEVFASDVSKVEENQILKLKMSFERQGKTYDATRNITLRNLVRTSANIGDIYQEDLAPAIPATITFTQYTNEMKPRAVFDFDAVVNNSDENTLIWTVNGATSSDTFINIATGVLTIGATEEKDNVISVVATLAANRNVYATYSVTILEEDPATIEIVDFPEYVLCGYEYEIEAEVEPDDTPYVWELTDANGTETGLDGETIIYATDSGYKLKISEEQTRTAPVNATLPDVQAQAVISLTGREPIKSNTMGAIVRIPEMAVGIYGEEDGQTSFDKGSTIVLEPDWSESYKQKVEYGNAVYVRGDFSSDSIKWEVYYNKDGIKKTISLGSDGGYRLPVETVDGNTVYITGTSTKFPMVTATRQITLADASVQLVATINGTKYTVDNTVVALDNKVYLKAQLSGIQSGASYIWKAYVNDKESTTLLKPYASDSSQKYFTAEQSLSDKTIKIVVTEQYSGATDSITFKVDKYTKCNITDASDLESIEYLYTNKSNASQYPFFLKVDNLPTNRKVKVTAQSYDDYGRSTSVSFSSVLNVTRKENGLLFEPVAQPKKDKNKIDYSKFAYVVYHIDDYTTGQHIAMFKLEPVLTNFSFENRVYVEGRHGGYWEEIDVNIYVPYLDRSIGVLEGSIGSANTYTETYNFINYHGEDFNADSWWGEADDVSNPKSYTCKYEFNSNKNRCYLDIIEDDDEIESVTYRKYSGGWYED